MKKCIENFNDYPMISHESEISKQNYKRYRFGRLKHEFWLKSRKDKNYVYLDHYDNFIIKNLQKGSTCYFCSSGYYVEDLVQDLTVIEMWPVVKAFYPKCKIISHRQELTNHYCKLFDNFVVINNRGDHWVDINGMKKNLEYYSSTLKDAGLLFYSFRDTQIQGINRLKQDQEVLFKSMALDCKKFGLNLIWSSIEFSDKTFPNMLENPDTTNGNIKFIFQKKTDDYIINETN